ncbi:MAG TPA: hypothetical protein VF042_00015, partial [Gemmatimonadaceae bacterium]
ITLLPGLSDLRGNARNTGAVTIFSTGPTIPTGRFSGKIFNWAEGRVVGRNGFVQAWPRGDTTTMYMAPVDSAGTYVLQNLPPGSYVIRGISDDNNNRGLDRREAWDTVGVNLTDTAHVNLYAFIHDSLGTRMTTVAVRDSVTVDVGFDTPISTAQPITPPEVRVVAPDSSVIGVLSVSPPPPDTTAAARALGRPIPPRSVTLKLAQPLKPKTNYRVRIARIPSLGGVSRPGDILLATPEKLPSAPAPKPPTPQPSAPPASPPPPPAPVKR